MPSFPLLAESHRFSMIFLLSSGCCSSLRWKKGKRKTDRRKVKRKKEEVKVNQRDNAHMDDMWMRCGQGSNLSQCECG